MVFVKNEKKYWEFIRELRNNPKVKGGFITQNEITQEQQACYMTQHNDNFYVCLWGDTPVGYVGVINEDIRVATHPDFQGRGVGKFMINELMKKYPDSTAKVKIQNVASLKLFQACGFKKKYYLLERE